MGFQVGVCLRYISLLKCKEKELQREVDKSGQMYDDETNLFFLLSWRKMNVSTNFNIWQQLTSTQFGNKSIFIFI